MSLTNLFNFNFLKENIKKSKAIILLCMLLMPILNTIIYLMNTSNKKVYVPSIYDLSGILILFMYIIPVILSIVLFSFVYKRKSADFVTALPISKKKMFLTNTLGGILIILTLQLVNYLLLLIVSMTFSSILIDYRMLFDIFVVYSTAYIFVFTCTNIAVSLSSNKITTVIVTALILFLVPFISLISKAGSNYDRIDKVVCENEMCRPTTFTCDTMECEVNKASGIYETYLKEKKNVTYTLPFGIIGGYLNDSSYELMLKGSVIKMAILNIIYIIIGMIIYIRKKFEVVDTSFKSEKVHILVRSLTTVPLISILYFIVKDMTFNAYNYLFFTLALVMLIVYLIVYDLITRKKITNFIKTLVALIITSIIVIFIIEIDSNNTNTLNVKDIDSISFENNNLLSSGYSKDKELINYAISTYLDKGVVTGDNYFKSKIRTKNKLYEINYVVDDKGYEYITNKLNKDKDYLNSSKNIKEKDIFAVSSYHSNMYLDNNISKDIISYYIKNSNNLVKEGNDLLNIYLYTYNNYMVNKIYFNISNNKELSTKILNSYNERTRKYLSNLENEEGIRMYFVGHDDGEYGIWSNYDIINKFIVDNINERIDASRKYHYIRLEGYDDSCIFVTNKVDEFDEIFNKIEEQEDKETVEGDY